MDDRKKEARKELARRELKRREEVKIEEAKPGKVESFARGAAQGATLGFADEISSGASAAFSTVGKLLKGEASIDQFITDYKEDLEESRANFEAAATENPITSIAGNIGGAVASSAAAGAAGLVGGATKLGSVASGIVSGGIFGAGASEGSVTEGAEGITEIAKDTAIGAAMGGVFGKLGQGLGKLEKALSNKIPASPQEFMQKLNFNKKAFRLSSGGKSSAEEAIANLQSKGLLPTTKQELSTLSAGDVQKALGLERAKLGGAIGAAIDRADEVLPDMGINRLGLRKLVKDVKGLKKSGFDADVNLALDEVESFFATEVNNAKTLQQGKKIIDQALHTISTKLSPSSLEQTKVRALFNARGRIKSKLEEVIEEVAKKDPNLQKILQESGKKSFKEINEDFSSIASISHFVDDSAAAAAKSEQSFGQAMLNELASPSGAVAGLGITGAITGGVTGSAVGAGVGAIIKAAAKTGYLERATINSLEGARTVVGKGAKALSETFQRDVNIASKLYQTYNPEDHTLQSPEERKVHIGNVLQNSSISHAAQFREVNQVQKTGRINPSLLAPHIKSQAEKQLDIENRSLDLERQIQARAMNQLRGL